MKITARITLILLLSVVVFFYWSQILWGLAWVTGISLVAGTLALLLEAAGWPNKQLRK